MLKPEPVVKFSEGATITPDTLIKDALDATLVDGKEKSQLKTRLLALFGGRGEDRLYSATTYPTLTIRQIMSDYPPLHEHIWSKKWRHIGRDSLAVLQAIYNEAKKNAAPSMADAAQQASIIINPLLSENVIIPVTAETAERQFTEALETRNKSAGSRSKPDSYLKTLRHMRTGTPGDFSKT